MLAFGPIPSRRLGRSLGINNVPVKNCSYSCIYCQLGLTFKKNFERREFYKPENIVNDVKKKINKVKETGETIDYLTFVPDGEPTLDLNLGNLIDLLKKFGVKIAVLTNSSLIWNPDVRRDLAKADLVSLKIDSTIESIWHAVNRPNEKLKLTSILDGAIDFTKMYDGELLTETMLIKNVNDSENSIKETRNYISKLKPSIAYLSIPIRPPSEEWVRPADEDIINRTYQIFSEKIDHVEYLIGYEGNAFAFTGNVEENLLSIMAVHPMRKEAIHNFLIKANANWSVIEKLLRQNKLISLSYQGNDFYMRKLEFHQSTDYKV
jgi:wyosine [tRNA(Phe)-imidazoG37] synthetase (radical SAM superfamily)